MTPFASRLKLELDQEFDRMCNNWFFKWHFIGGDETVKIESFRTDDRPICYGGIAYSGSAILVYWDTITTYAIIKTQECFNKCETDIQDYPIDIKLRAIDETETLVNAFVGKIRNKAIDVDKILRGDGINFPPPRDSGNWSGALHTDTRRLGDGLKEILGTPQHDTDDKGALRNPKLPDVKFGLSGPTSSVNEWISFLFHHLWKRPKAWWKSRSTPR